MIIELPSYTPGQHLSTAELIPDAGALQDFVVRLLSQRLNSEIDAWNTAHPPATGEKELPSIADVLPSPAKVGDNHVNHVLVGMSVQRQISGHRAIENRDSILTIAIVDRPISNAADIAPTWKRADIVAAILEPFTAGLNVSVGAENSSSTAIRGWNELCAMSVQALPENEAFSGYSGVLLTYSFWQAPGVTNLPD